MASLIEAASLSPALVLVPDHALVAWHTGDGGGWDYLETTWIGTTFDAAVGQGRMIAKRFEEEDPGGLRRLALDDLRAAGVMPME
jgi:hypothetical protein